MIRILRRLFVAVSFILLVEFALLWWGASAGWIALISGFLGSMLLIVPPLRIEYWKANRSTVDEVHPNPAGDVPVVQAKVRQRLTEKIEEWDEWDTFFMMLGGALLALHFVFQGIWEHNIIDRAEVVKALQNMQEQLNQFKQKP